MIQQAAREVKQAPLVTKLFFLLVTVLLALLSWQGGRIVNTIDTLSSSLTGHLIEHGRSDANADHLKTDMNEIKSSVKKMQRNQVKLCTYEEPKWQSHDRCER